MQYKPGSKQKIYKYFHSYRAKIKSHYIIYLQSKIIT